MRLYDSDALRRDLFCRATCNECLNGSRCYLNLIICSHLFFASVPNIHRLGTVSTYLITTMIASRKVLVLAVPSIGCVTAVSCGDLCQQAGGSWGHVIGTAPACRGVCASDCVNNVFFHVVYSGDVSDHGAGCWSGNKICCCATSLNSNVTVI